MESQQTMKSSNKNSVPTEHAEQVSLIQWFDKAYPELRIFSIPNGGKRGKLEAMRLQMEGVRPGVPDLMLPEPRGGFHGLFVEMKRTKGGSVSAEQKDWMAYLLGKGYQVKICKGYVEARKEIECYLSTTT